MAQKAVSGRLPAFRENERIADCVLLLLCYIGEGYLQVLFEVKSIFAPSCMTRFRFKSFSKLNRVSQNQKSCVFEFNKRFLIRLEFCLLFSLSGA